MQKTTFGNLLKFAIAAIITIALGTWVELSTGWSTILHQWQLIPITTIGLCMLMTLISHALRGVRLVHCYSLLPQEKPLNKIPVIAVSFIHNAANFMLPMRLGEVVLPVLSRYHLSIDIRQSVKVLLGIRLFDVHVLLVLVVLLQKGLLGQWQIPTLLFLMAGLAMLPLFRHVKYLNKIYPPQYMRYRTVAASYLLTLIIWLIKLLAFYWVFSAFTPIDFNTAALGILLADLSSTLPVNGFASAGSYEAAFVAGLYLTDSMHNALISAIINLHIFLLLSNILAFVAGWVVLILKRR